MGRVSFGFKFLQVLDECADFGPYQPRLLIQGGEFRFSDVALVQCDVEFALDFGARPFGLVQKANEFGFASAAKPCDVVHDRSRRRRTWSRKPKSRPLALFGCGVHDCRQIARELPCFDIFKSLDFQVCGSVNREPSTGNRTSPTQFVIESAELFPIMSAV